MRLLRDEIIAIGDFLFNTLGAATDFDASHAKSVMVEVKGKPGLAHIIDHDTIKDFGAAHEIVQEAKTIIVPTDLIHQFIGIGDRLKRQEVPWKLPFEPVANFIDRAEVQAILAVAYALIALVEHLPQTPEERRKEG